MIFGRKNLSRTQALVMSISFKLSIYSSDDNSTKMPRLHQYILLVNKLQKQYSMVVKVESLG